METKVIILCTLTTGLEVVSEVISRGIDIVCIIGLSPSLFIKDKISGYIDISDFASKRNIPFLLLDSYELKKELDKERILKLNYNLIWVCGWQRLIPNWLIDSAKFGAIGSHGSPDGIEGGRGRSPQNWALILGCKNFDLAVFKLTQGIDNGEIILEKSFFYNDDDDILISYYKCALLLSEMIFKIIKIIKITRSDWLVY